VPPAKPTLHKNAKLIEATASRCLEEIAEAVQAEPDNEEKLITALLCGHYVYVTILATAANAAPEVRQQIFAHATRAIRQSLNLDLTIAKDAR
jgi:hypothetical protein